MTNDDDDDHNNNNDNNNRFIKRHSFRGSGGTRKLAICNTEQVSF